MAFVGILSECKSFENIREYFKIKKELNLNLIHINRKSIENIKNIKFETIIIDSNIENFEKENLETICNNAKYLLINTDINTKYALNIEEKVKIITYGLNQKATVTVSSITENGMLIYLQRNITNIENKTIEIGEKVFKTGEKSKLKNYEIQIIYIISSIYCIPIMDEV